MRFVPVAVTQKVGRLMLHTQKNSPTIMFGVGVVGVVGTAVLTARATLKVEPILDDLQKDLDTIEILRNQKQFSDKQATKMKAAVMGKGAYQLTKLYAPAVAVGALTIGSFTGAHVTLNRRNASLTAAYVAVEKAYDSYREKVRAVYGEDAEREIYEDTTVVKAKDDAGKTRSETVLTDAQGRSPYGVVFDQHSRNWQPERWQNQYFLQCQQSWANDMLRARGHVFLNEVYDMLGLPRTAAGAVVGWVAGNGDDFIDFGIFEGDEISAKRFVNGDERSVWLDFNVDGVIYDLLDGVNS